MKKTLFIWLLLGYISFSYAQTVTIIDQDSKQALHNAVLISEQPKLSVLTNAQGQADISAFKDAEQILINSLGYKTQLLSYKQISASGHLILMTPSLLQLNETIISATRWLQSSSQVPSKLISITPEEISLQNPQTAADLLGMSGKVFIQKSQQGGGSPMIRGFATNRLIYTIDGVRMNTAIFRGGNLQNVINVDPFATEKTEVLFGPSSVIYGSDAIGGVMSFRTLTPQLSLSQKPLIEGKMIARYSSANKEKTGHLDLNVGWKKWALVTSFSSWDYNHLRQGSHGPNDYIKSTHTQQHDGKDVVITQEDPLLQIPSAYSQTNMMQKIRYRPNDNWDLQYGFHYSETSPYGRYDRHNRFKKGQPSYAEWNYGPQKWMMNQLSITHQSQYMAYDQMALRIAQQSFEESRIKRSFNKSKRSTQTETVAAYSVNLDFTKSFKPGHTLYYGTEYVTNDVNSEGKQLNIIKNISTPGPARYPEAQWQSIAAYLNDEIKLSDRFSTQLGIRYNHFMLDATFDNNKAFYPLPFSSANLNNGALTASLGSVYTPNETWILKANCGSAFRAPNVDDIGKIFDSEAGSVVVPNPNLKAEYAYNFDLSLAKLFGNSIKIDVTAYYTLLNNALVRRSFQLNGYDSILYDGQMSKVSALQNAASARVYGLQGGIEIKLAAGCTFSTDISYQVGREKEEDGSESPFRHAAPLFGSSRLRYHHQALTIELNTHYQGEKDYNDLPLSERRKDEIYAKDSNGHNYAPSWYTLNLKAMYQLNTNFRLTGGLENITDQRYRPYSSGISGPGRNFILSIQCNF